LFAVLQIQFAPMCGEISHSPHFRPPISPSCHKNMRHFVFIAFEKLYSWLFGVQFLLVPSICEFFWFRLCSILPYFYFIYNGNFLCFKQAAHCFLFGKGDWRLESARLAAIFFDILVGEELWDKKIV